VVYSTIYIRMYNVLINNGVLPMAKIEGKCQYCLEPECDCYHNLIQNGKFYKNSYWPIKEEKNERI